MLERGETEPEFVNCLKRIVVTDDTQEVKDIWDRLDEMENLESGSNGSTYDCNRNYDKYLRSILTETPVKNISEIPHVLEWFSKFPFPNTVLNPISDDIAHFMNNSAEGFEAEPVLVDIIQVITDNHKKYLPPHNNHTNLCKAIVEVLSWMPMPKTPMGMKGVIKIRDFLKKICASNISGSQENISLICFRKFCEIFLKDNREKDQSAQLIIVLQIVPDQLWKQHMDVAVKQIVNEFTDEWKIIKMLLIMCQWVILPPHAFVEYLSTWLSLFVKGLESNNKARITVELTETALPHIFCKCLKLDQFQNIEVQDNIVIQLLIRIRSLATYHVMILKLVTYLGVSDKSSMLPKELTLQKCIPIVNIVNMLSKRFPDHLTTSCNYCELMAKMYLQIQRESDEDASSHIPEEGEEMEISYPSTSSGVGRQDPSKVGLVNLGNTCYMNSVLQALAMTRRFCREVLLYKTTDDLTEQTVLQNLQNLFVLLKYSKRNSLAPTEILNVSRPSYFMPGQQQDSSEFLCHLLDVMYEQEKSALKQDGSSDQISAKSKVENKEMVVVEEDPQALNSPLNDDGKTGNMTRWTTEENLSEGASLQRKTQSLADFTQGEELAQTQNGLSDSHSDSADSGIQSVGGEDSTSSSVSASSTSSPAGTVVAAAAAATTSPSTNDKSSSTSAYLVHRVFGGELKVIYQCLKCGNESHNTDRFRDLQLCFFDNVDPAEAKTVQDLIKLNYFMPETLTGDNKYRCDKCAGLCDAQRSIKILQAPAHLILTLKHFRYDSESRLRTKLRRKVVYDETIQLPVLDKNNETYQLYAAVVHSGYSLDYGHYITYACDAKNRWYKFNDSYVAQTTIEDFKRLEPPDTPYILFYKRCTAGEEDNEDDAPDFETIGKSLQEFVEQDRRRYAEERRRRPMIGSQMGPRFNPSNSWDKDKNDDDDAGGGGGSQPPSNCRDALNIPNQPFLC